MAPWPVMGVPELDAAEHTDTKAVLCMLYAHSEIHRQDGQTKNHPAPFLL